MPEENKGNGKGGKSAGLIDRLKRWIAGAKDL